MRVDVNDLRCGSAVRGRLAIVGSGIAAIAHLTMEAIGHIKQADIVFYNANSGGIAAYLHELNANTIDLYQYYGEGKLRDITYVQMAEVMLRHVRLGQAVVGVFHGHPGYFVKAARRALAIAQAEGHETILTPGISATDCLFADLRIDPAVIGIQILKASHALLENTLLATNNHVVLVQVGSVGDDTFSFSGLKHPEFDLLIEKLISVYGEDHDSVYYVASIFPGFDPVITVRRLGEYRNERIRDTVKTATFYLPPAGVRFRSLTSRQAFNDSNPYGQFELGAIAEIVAHEMPTGDTQRGASRPMLQAVIELGTDPELAMVFRQAPEQFVARHPDLTAEEREALLSREIGKMRSATMIMPKMR